MAAKPTTSVAGEAAEQSCKADGSEYKEQLIVQKGNAAASLLYIKVSSPSVDQPCGTRMPQAEPDEPLSQDEIDAIRQWIDDGANNN